ncbi:SCP-like extracellular [Caballeronia calidae]|uniref:SCP-like extracellular n=1 Tax=Caballeronia calidae TaxID=1777139 RepID=A0A158EH59_9BURK|nr:CAP domain-containing protein [Caballeronia calidae]SAL05227.1 SCP-like extracellular [Caballeronia calidae]
MNKKNKITAFLTSSITIASAVVLAACGGGGGSSSPTTSTPTSSSSSTSQTVTGTLSTPQYASTSAQLAAFNMLNQYRTQCGFPALQENTVLDTAAQNHAKYIGLNNTITDTEVLGNPGFTGVTYATRATYATFPQSVFVTGASGAGNEAFSSSFSAAVAGQQFIYSLLGGVYHNVVAAYPANLVGYGEYQTQSTVGAYTYTDSWQSMSLSSTQAQTVSNAPLTFPCQGVSGLPYKDVLETPTAPNASSSGWGTPVVVMGNSTDAVLLQSGTMTDTSGNQIILQVLNSTTDPNKELAAFQAVAYPASPLSPNTTYSVSLTGTVNGTAFSRSFTFTTGNVVG